MVKSFARVQCNFVKSTLRYWFISGLHCTFFLSSFCFLENRISKSSGFLKILAVKSTKQLIVSAQFFASLFWRIQSKTSWHISIVASSRWQIGLILLLQCFIELYPERANEVSRPWQPLHTSLSPCEVFQTNWRFACLVQSQRKQWNATDLGSITAALDAPASTSSDLFLSTQSLAFFFLILPIFFNYTILKLNVWHGTE